MTGALASFVAALVVGLVVGMASGMLGIGGGSIMLPLFRLAFGMGPVTSTATSLFTIIPTSLSGAISRVRQKTCKVKLGVALGVGGACTSPIGAWLANISPGWAVMVAAALVIFYSATTMLRKALSLPKGPAKEAGAGGANPASATAPAGAGAAAPAGAGAAAQAGAGAGAAGQAGAGALPEASASPEGGYAKAVVIGAIAGLASGYVGLGGGFLMVPLMLSLLHMPMRLASGTSLIAIVILAAPATVLQCAMGNVDYLVGIAVACGSIPGAFLGGRLASRAPERGLRFGFAAFLGIAALMLVVNELGLLG